MPLSPLEIQQKQFRTRVFRGLDAKEVESFLQKAADQMSALLKNLDEAKRELNYPRNKNVLYFVQRK